MKNAKSVYLDKKKIKPLEEIKQKEISFFQRDNQIEKILSNKDILILPSSLAWQKYSWTKKFFGKKPKEGYFIWLKKQINFPLFICLGIYSPQKKQNLNNLLVIEKNVKVKVITNCYSQKRNLKASHQAKGKIILKEKSQLNYHHFHYWHSGDKVSSDYKFILKNNSSLSYSYKNFSSPKKLLLKNLVYLEKDASTDLKITTQAEKSEMKIIDSIILAGKNSQGILKLRLVGKKDSQIENQSEITAKKQSKGHLDCQGLLVEKRSEISTTPKLVCQSKEAQLTHEASIGKVSEEELNYLRQRGFKESEAINLIVNGFLQNDL